MIINFILIFFLIIYTIITKMTENNWTLFEQKSLESISQTGHNKRLTLKYRNKPARGKLILSNNNKVFIKIIINIYL